MKRNVKQIGEIGVDAGLCWIGDPCYILHQEVTPKAVGKNWEEFCEILRRDKQYPTAKQLNYNLGHPGLGVVVSTGYGDGVYPVYAAYGDEGRIAKVWVEFMDEESPEQTLASADDLNTPWSLHFDRDGTEDVAVICDGKGEDLARSRHFWLPQEHDPVPPTLAAMRVMAAGPELLAFAAQIARMTMDGEEIDGEEFVMENDDAVDTLNALIDGARHLTAKAAGRRA